MGLAIRGRERADHARGACSKAAIVPQEDADGLLKPKAFIVLKTATAASAG